MPCSTLLVWLLSGACCRQAVPEQVMHIYFCNVCFVLKKTNTFYRVIFAAYFFLPFYIWKRINYSRLEFAPTRIFSLSVVVSCCLCVRGTVFKINKKKLWNRRIVEKCGSIDKRFWLLYTNQYFFSIGITLFLILIYLATAMIICEEKWYQSIF